jgi:hypothetical protein
MVAALVAVGSGGGVAFAQDDPPPIIIIDDTKKPDERRDDPDPEPEPRNLFRPRFSLVLGGFAPVGALADAFPNRWGGSALFAVQINRPRPKSPFAFSVFYEGVAVSQGVEEPFSSVFSRSTAEYFGMQGGGVEGALYLTQGSPLKIYVGGGGGFYELKREVSYAGNAFLEPVFSKDDIFSSSRYTFGWRLLAGVEIGRYFVSEVRYIDAGRLDRVAFRGLSVSLGFRY